MNSGMGEAWRDIQGGVHCTGQVFDRENPSLKWKEPVKIVGSHDNVEILDSNSGSIVKLNIVWECKY